MSAIDEHTPPLPEQQKALLAHAAGYSSHRTIAIGLRSGLVEALAARPDGARPDQLAEHLDLDPFYVEVWCRSALAAGVCERADDGYRLAPYVDTLLLDRDSPVYVGGLFHVFEQRELFGRFEEALASGEGLWWDETSPEWIASVASTGTPFYTRLIPRGLAHVPRLAERLEAGCRVVDAACGVGTGLVKLAEAYPNCELVGVDGDAYSIELAHKRVTEAGVADRVSLYVSPLEEMALDEPATLVINNVSMHECRDIDASTQRVWDTLEPRGWFVVSDFPFPETDQSLATVPGRIMCGIQFFEAQIDDQLLPRSAYDQLLTRHDFSDLGSAQLAPVHALTWGRRA